jgi:hypothetical protein
MMFSCCWWFLSFRIPYQFSTASRSVLGPTQTPIQWVPGSISPEQKRPGPQADQSSPSNAAVKNGRNIPPLLPMSSWRNASLSSTGTTLFFLGFRTKTLWTSALSHACYMSFPSHLVDDDVWESDSKTPLAPNFWFRIPVISFTLHWTGRWLGSRDDLGRGAEGEIWVPAGNWIISELL